MQNHGLAVTLTLLLVAATTTTEAQNVGNGSAGAVMGVPSKGSLNDSGNANPDIGGVPSNDDDGSPRLPTSGGCPDQTPAPGMTTAEQQHENRQCRSPRAPALTPFGRD